MTKTRTTLLALSAAVLVALSAIAMPVAADDDEQDDSRREMAKQDAQARREAAKQDAEHRREMAKDAAEQRGNHTKERCLAAAGNASVNETDEERCMKHGEFAEKAFKARRAAHALLGAINATERQWERLNATEERLEARLAAGNVSANETERIEKRLERIDEKQERLEERLERLRERLAKLHDKWDAVREHVSERRGKGHGSPSESSSSSSASSSASESESESGSPSESSSSSSPPA